MLPRPKRVEIPWGRHAISISHVIVNIEQDQSRLINLMPEVERLRARKCQCCDVITIATFIVIDDELPWSPNVRFSDSEFQSGAIGQGARRHDRELNETLVAIADSTT